MVSFSFNSWFIFRQKRIENKSCSSGSHKMTVKSLVLIIGVYCVSGHHISESGYYWREYSGTVPEDALIGGRNSDGVNVYVGKGYLKNIGILPGTIINGRKEMIVPWGNVGRSTKYNNILCGPTENFYWMKANASDLHFQVTGKHTVRGGHDDDLGYLDIGRISYGGNIKIGKIASFWIGNALFYYADGHVEKSASSYEILMYNITPEVDVVASIFKN